MYNNIRFSGEISQRLIAICKFMHPYTGSQTGIKENLNSSWVFFILSQKCAGERSIQNVRACTHKLFTRTMKWNLYTPDLKGFMDALTRGFLEFLQAKKWNEIKRSVYKLRSFLMTDKHDEWIELNVNEKNREKRRSNYASRLQHYGNTYITPSVN